MIHHTIEYNGKKAEPMSAHKTAVCIYLTPDQADQLRGEAERSGNSQSTIVRQLLDEHWRQRDE
jgi:hypothetical protein